MSDDNRYHVRLTGELMGGADADRVAANLARLFKMPEEKAALLVSGKPRVVKKDADEATARKFQVALRQAGARCELLPQACGDNVLPCFTHRRSLASATFTLLHLMREHPPAGIDAYRPRPTLADHMADWPLHGL